MSSKIKRISHILLFEDDGYLQRSVYLEEEIIRFIECYAKIQSHITFIERS
jgi:hypothetical protein